MKKIYLLFIMLLTPFHIWCQTVDYYSLQTFYYQNKDISIVDSSIAFLNQNINIDDKAQFKLAAFFIALFDDQPLIKKTFKEKENLIENNDRIIQYALEMDKDAFLFSKQINPTWNDVYWNMFFATGNNGYLDLLIENIKYNDERNDLIKYITGASAKWSMSSNIQQHEQVKVYIHSLIDSEDESYKHIFDLFELDLYEFEKETENIIREQRDKGIW